MSYLKHLHLSLKAASQKHVITDVEDFLKLVRVSNLPKVRVTVKANTCVLEKWASWKRGFGSEVVLQKLSWARASQVQVLHGSPFHGS